MVRWVEYISRLGRNARVHADCQVNHRLSARASYFPCSFPFPLFFCEPSISLQPIIPFLFPCPTTKSFSHQPITLTQNLWLYVPARQSKP